MSFCPGAQRRLTSDKIWELVPPVSHHWASVQNDVGLRDDRGWSSTCVLSGSPTSVWTLLFVCFSGGLSNLSVQDSWTGEKSTHLHPPVSSHCCLHMSGPRAPTTRLLTDCLLVDVPGSFMASMMASNTKRHVTSRDCIFSMLYCLLLLVECIWKEDHATCIYVSTSRTMKSSQWASTE